jgi:hypothetical protein
MQVWRRDGTPHMGARAPHPLPCADGHGARPSPPSQGTGGGGAPGPWGLYLKGYRVYLIRVSGGRGR